MPQPLPDRPNLHYLRTCAKSVLKSHRARDPSCLDMLRGVKRFAGKSDEVLLSTKVSLLDVQYALALRYGFTSWDELRREVTNREKKTMGTQAKETAQLDVHIETLKPMVVASFYGHGTSPEMTAHQKLRNWAEPKGMLGDFERYPVFGFNNPSPHGARVYGYEVWMQLDHPITPEGDMRVVEFAGGTYAVARCEDLDTIGSVWHRLAQWPERNGYRHATHQWLERSVGQNDKGPVLDCCLPVAR